MNKTINNTNNKMSNLIIETRNDLATQISLKVNCSIDYPINAYLSFLALIFNFS